MYSGRRSLALCACVLLLWSCSDGPSEPDDAFDVEVALVSGNDQVGPAGQELPQPLVAEVLNGAGNPVADVLVNFRVVSGGGRAYAGTARTDQQGRVQDYWTLGSDPAQTQRLEVRAVRSGNKRVFATFRATAVVPAAPPQQE